MSYHTCKNYRVYQRFVHCIPLNDGSMQEIHDYCLILWTRQLEFYTNYAFEMIELLKIVEAQYGHEVPQSLIDRLRQQSEEDDELNKAKEVRPSLYG